jgi:6-phosphogluconolactonase
MTAEGTAHVYVGQAEGEQISVLRLDQRTGRLDRVQDVRPGGPVKPMAVTPDRRFLFAALRTDPAARLASLAIDRDSGRLRLLANVPAPDGAVHMQTDRTGRFLLAAHNPVRDGHHTGFLSIRTIGDDGRAGPRYAIIETPPKLHAALFDPSNRFILGASCDGDAVMRYAFDAKTGIAGREPVEVVSVEPGRGPRHLRFHPHLPVLYLVTEYAASVHVFRHDFSGALAQTQSVEASPPGYQPMRRREGKISAAGADIHLTPDGRFLYASVRGSLTMAAFAVDPATGALTPAGHFPMPSEPRGFAIDPAGRYLLAAGDRSARLVCCRIDPDSGGLEPLAEHETGGGPNWVECIAPG